MNYNDMNNEFMVTGGKKTQQIEGSISVTPTPGAATEAKQDTIIASIEDIGVTTDVKVTLDGETVPVTGTFYQATQPVSIAATVAVDPTDDPTRDNGKVDIASLDQYTPVAGRLPVDGSGVTQPVSGTFWQATQPVSIASSVPVTDNAGSLTVDAPVATPVFVRLSDGASAITTLPVSLASVPSHAVTNAGTFAVQSTNQANSGVDIGDVTINNAAGAAAVNIQDGGNTITVDGTVSVTGSTVQDIPATSGGLSKFHLVGAATTNATNVKASAGQVYAITAFNVAATPAYLKFHNTAGTPTAGAGVTETFLIPGNTAGAGLAINFDKGIAFATGIGISIVTGIADANASAIAADNVVVNIYYK